MKRFYTSESVGMGHPDKLCDQISDAVLDDVIRQDPNSRVACETYITMGLVIVGGEITTRSFTDVHNIVRNLIKEVGYTHPKYGFDYETCAIVNAVHSQSPDIAQGVNRGGAGDQGCLKKGTLVKTDKGFLPIEEIKKGDLVVTPYGLRKVLEARKTGVKNIVELIFSNGMRLECTPEHRVFCYSKDGKTYWQEASKLTSKDFVCILKSSEISSSKYITSRVEKKEFFTKYNHKIYGQEEVILDDEIAYIAGLLIGDGACNNKMLMEISFGRDRGYALKVKKMLDRKFSNQWRLIQAKDGTFNLKIDSVLVRRHFENFGVGYNKAPEKVTPQAIFISPKNVIKAYLRGLFDSDGTVVPNTGRKKENIRVRLGSTSYKLLEETQLLLNDFRIKSSILFNAPKGIPVGKDKRYKSKHDSFALSLAGFESYQNFGKQIGFSHPQKAKRLRRYLEAIQTKPKNSPSIYLLPHPYKEEMIGEELISKNLPFGITTVKTKVKKSKAEVYDLEISKRNVFSANGVFVHNSMIGYACSESPEFMPLPIMLSHKLVMQMAKVRKEGILSYLGPDGKSQVTVEYHNGKPVCVDTVVLACQHTDEILNRSGDAITQRARNEIIEAIAKPVLKGWIDKDTKYFVNQTGKFVIGGPQSDTGMTGRKIIVDTYGGCVPHGGGCFSGKDPTKVDRSAAYMARYAAKNIVAAGLAKRCLIQLAYVIGKAQPLSIMVDTSGTSSISEEKIVNLIRKKFDLTPKGIIKTLDLLKPIYRKTACFGHFGRPEFSWEKLDKVKELQNGLRG